MQVKSWIDHSIQGLQHSNGFLCKETFRSLKHEKTISQCGWQVVSYTNGDVGGISDRFTCKDDSGK